MPLAKTIIKRDFPKVRKIVDATETLNITVLPQDAAQGRRKDPEGCALVRACVRQRIADAAIIGIGYSYLIRGDTAVRYKTSAAVAREITSFDRHQDFAPGVAYKLSKVGPSAQLGSREKFKYSSGPHTTTKKEHPIVHKAPVHQTSNVRVLRSPAKTR